MRKNRIIAFITMALIAVMGIFHTDFLPVQAASAEVILYHHHCSTCETSGYKTQSSTNKGTTVTESTDVCSLCGGVHHYYRFTCKCSCGKSWEATGHACYNSPYGTGQGSCPNYSVVNSSTTHKHPTKVITCGKTEDTCVGKLGITSDQTSYCKEENLIFSATELDGITIDSKNWNSGETGESITINSNGTYTCSVNYTENGESYQSSVSINISNIDLEAPTIRSLTADPSKPTNQNVILHIDASDAQSGLHENAYSWAGQAYGSSADYEVKQNGTYQVKVRDALGNETETTITVDNIDKISPKVTLSASPKTLQKGSCTITATASDQDSGLAESPYSWDEGKSWNTESTMTVNCIGTYHCWVKDMAENIEKASISIKKSAAVPGPSPDNPPSEKPSETPSEVPSEKPSEKTSEERKRPSEKPAEHSEVESEEPSEEESVEESESITKETKLVVPEPRLIKEKKETQQETVQQAPAKKTMPTVKKAIIGVGSLLGGVLVIYGLYWLLVSATIYSKSKNGQKCLGKAILRVNNGRFVITISEKMWSKADTNMLKIVIPKAFVRMFAYKELQIRFRDAHYVRSIEHEQTLEIKG